MNVHESIRVDGPTSLFTGRRRCAVVLRVAGKNGPDKITTDQYVHKLNLLPCSSNGRSCLVERSGVPEACYANLRTTSTRCQSLNCNRNQGLESTH